MSDQPRNWDKELADIDRVVANQGTGPSVPVGQPGTARAPAGGTPETGPVRRRSVALTWFWVIMALALAAALPLWPYEKACGLRLMFFLGATAMAAVVGVLGATSSWANRRGLAQVLSLLVIAWAGVIAAREVLPRIGYAREAADWVCPADLPPPAPAPTPQPGSQPS